MLFPFKFINESLVISFKFDSGNLSYKWRKLIPMTNRTNILYTSHAFHNRIPLFGPFSEICFKIDVEILDFVLDEWCLPKKAGIISLFSYLLWRWIPRFLTDSLVSFVKPLDHPCLFLESDVKFWWIVLSW